MAEPLRLFNVSIAHKAATSLWEMLVQVKGPLQNTSENEMGRAQSVVKGLHRTLLSSTRDVNFIDH